MLLHKLKYYGVRGSTLNWIASFLQNHTQTVLVNGKISKETPVLSGVLQGTVLGLLLFLADCITSQIKLFHLLVNILFMAPRMLYCSIMNLLWSLMSKMSTTFLSVSYRPCSRTGVTCVASDFGGIIWL